jgi:hypothetical protein
LFRYFSPFRNDFGNLRLWLGGAGHKRSRWGRNSLAQTSVGASFNLAAENCCNCNNIVVKESSMRQFKGGLNEIAG